MKSLSLGFHEIRELLKLSLTSATPLTDMVMKNTVENPQSGICLDHILQDAAAMESRKIVLKAFLHKSTNKFLFAEASDEFVELLLSFLTVPLGGVVFLLGSNTPFKCIENLYRCVSDGGIDDEYFTTSETKNRLMNMKLAHGYLSKNQLLPLNEEGPPKLYYENDWKREYNYEEMCWESTGYECSFRAKQRNRESQVSSFKSNKGVFLKKQAKCYVSDDLTMSPSLASKIMTLTDVGIPLSDMKETEFHIGPNEALSIFKASLTSKTALTECLFKSTPMRQPKKEH